MTRNIMKDVRVALGLKPQDVFRIENRSGKYRITDRGLETLYPRTFAWTTADEGILEDLMTHPEEIVKIASCFMDEVARLYGVELEEEFSVEDRKGIYCFKSTGLKLVGKSIRPFKPATLSEILTGYKRIIRVPGKAVRKK